MYDILVYLFENCQQHEVSDEKERVAKKLSAAGFEESDISEALTWLAGGARGPHRSFAPLPATGAAFRAYAPKELAKLDAECRGLLIYFEQSGILNPQSRETMPSSNARGVDPRCRDSPPISTAPASTKAKRGTTSCSSPSSAST